MDIHNAYALIQRTLALRAVANDANAMGHAIRYNETCPWMPFIPTRFIYNVFTFNTLCNINWQASLDNGDVTDHGAKISEGTRRREFLRFCFSDKRFIRSYRDTFLNRVLGNRSVKEVLESFSKICLDLDEYGMPKPNGSIYDQSCIDEFQSAVKETLADRVVSMNNCDIIYRFIYKIRCNIFHGIKSITEMSDSEQEDRLSIYSDYLTAANMTVFDYLWYLDSRSRTRDEDE